MPRPLTPAKSDEMNTMLLAPSRSFLTPNRVGRGISIGKHPFYLVSRARLSPNWTLLCSQSQLLGIHKSQINLILEISFSISSSHKFPCCLLGKVCSLGSVCIGITAKCQRKAMSSYINGLLNCHLPLFHLAREELTFCPFFPLAPISQSTISMITSIFHSFFIMETPTH